MVISIYEIDLHEYKLHNIKKSIELYMKKEYAYIVKIKQSVAPLFVRRR